MKYCANFCFDACLVARGLISRLQRATPVGTTLFLRLRNRVRRKTGRLHFFLHYLATARKRIPQMDFRQFLQQSFDSPFRKALPFEIEFRVRATRFEYLYEKAKIDLFNLIMQSIEPTQF